MNDGEWYMQKWLNFPSDGITYKIFSTVITKGHFFTAFACGHKLNKNKRNRIKNFGPDLPAQWWLKQEFCKSMVSLGYTGKLFLKTQY